MSAQAPLSHPLDAAPWRARLRRFLKPPRRLKFTRMGRFYTGFTLVMGAAAINTGNNLLFLLLGLMLAGIVLSGVLSESTLRGLVVERVLPPDAQAGKACLVGLTVRNTKARLPSWAVVARDMTSRGEAGRSFALRLAGGETRELAYRWEPQARGLVEFVGIELATRYPFGLFEKWRTFDVEGAVVVFPREVQAPIVRVREARAPGERLSNRAGMGSEFFALRDARTGDDWRHVHWATSARRGHAVVTEREREHRRRLAVVVDNRVPGSATAADLDRAVEKAAALVRQAARRGAEVSLVTNSETILPSSGLHHERRILRALALLGPSRDDRAPEPPRTGDAVSVVVRPAEGGAG